MAHVPPLVWDGLGMFTEFGVWPGMPWHAPRSYIPCHLFPGLAASSAAPPFKVKRELTGGTRMDVAVECGRGWDMVDDIL
jgi:hypothetical protein